MSVGRFFYQVWAVLLLMMASMMTSVAPAQVSAEAATTGTLNLRAGTKVGEFLVGDKMVIRTRVLRPDVNRDLAFKATSPAPGRQLLTADRGEVRMALLNPETFVSDFSVKSGTTAVAIIEVVSIDAPTSATINWDRNSVILHDGIGPVIIQVDGTRVLRSTIKDGVRIVAPLRAGQAARLMIGREELSLDILRKLNLTSLRNDLGPFRGVAPNGRAPAGRLPLSQPTRII